MGDGPSPNPGHSNELFAVAATSSGNAWAVGDATNGIADQTLVLHMPWPTASYTLM
jgi:hypothetical protein